MNIVQVVGVVLSVAVLVDSLPTQQCSGENFEDLSERIEVIPCGKTKCKLPKEQNVTVNFRFRTKSYVKTLNNDVFANVAGIPLPFIGVHGTDACRNVLNEDKTPASCPLEPNKEYLYTNLIYVEPFYPEIPMTVHWSLNDGTKSVICFEIPAAIVKKKKTSS